MIARLLCLLLACALALVTQSPVAAAQTGSVMSCCVEDDHQQSCPDCPTSPAGNHRCCCTMTVILFTAAVEVRRTAGAPFQYGLEETDFSTRSDRPVLPPPKVA